MLKHLHTLHVCIARVTMYRTKKFEKTNEEICSFNPNPTKKCNVQISGQMMMSGHFSLQYVLQTSVLLSNMCADVSLNVTKNIICEVGRRYLKSYPVAKRLM